MPDLDSSGTHHFTGLAKAHQADIGNSKPTTYMAEMPVTSTRRVRGMFAATRMDKRYEMQTDIVRIGRMRIRSPEQSYERSPGPARRGAFRRATARSTRRGVRPGMFAIALRPSGSTTRKRPRGGKIRSLPRGRALRKVHGTTPTPARRHVDHRQRRDRSTELSRLRVDERMLLPDADGAGQHRGATC